MTLSNNLMGKIRSKIMNAKLKKLEIIIDQVIDKTLEIEPLMKELDKLNKKRKSKKKFTIRLEIMHQIKNLMNQ